MKARYIFVLLPETWAWTGSAHIDITYLAWKLMGRKGKGYLKQHLGHEPHDIYRASTWADSAAAMSEYQGSEKLHYSNTPKNNCQPFVLVRDCGKQHPRKCIVTGFAEFATIASDPSQSKSARADAIRFLLHLLADMHQPLHAGFSDDLGGNKIHLLQPDMSLHEIWDYGLFNPSIQDVAITPLENTIQSPGDMGSRENVLQYAAQVISETSTMYTCNFAYTDTDGTYIRNGGVLSPEYMVSRKAVAMDRLRIAGIRLAEFMDALAENYYSRMSLSKLVSPVIAEGLELSNQFTVLDGLLDDVFESDESLFSPCSVEDSIQMISAVAKIPKSLLDDGTYEIDQVFERPQSVANVTLSDVIMIQSGGASFLSTRSVIEDKVRSKLRTFVLHPSYFIIKFTSRGGQRPAGKLKLAVDRDCSFTRRLTVDDVLLILTDHFGERFRYQMTIVEIPFDDPTHYAKLSNELIGDAIRLPGRLARIWKAGGLQGDQKDDAYKQMSYRCFQDYLNIDSQHQEAMRENRTLEENWERRLLTNSPSAKAILIENTQIFFHRDTFVANPCATRSFMFFKTASSLGARFLLIDTNLFVGDLTPRIVHTLMRIKELRSEQSPQKVGTLVPEMFHLVKLIEDTATDRLRKSPFQEILTCPSHLSQTVAYLHWNLTSEFTQGTAC